MMFSFFFNHLSAEVVIETLPTETLQIKNLKLFSDQTSLCHITEHSLSKTFLLFFCPAAKLVPVGYGIKKLQIGCVVEDDKVRNLLNISIIVYFPYFKF